MEIVNDYSKIVIDIAICAYIEPPQEEATSKRAWQNFLDVKAIKQYWKSTNQVEKEMRAYPGVRTRYYF
jgi:hypothetical protein